MAASWSLFAGSKVTSTFVPRYLLWNRVMTLSTQFRYADPGVDVVSTPPSHSWRVLDLAPLLDELRLLLHAATANTPASARTSRVRNLVTGPRARLVLRDHLLSSHSWRLGVHVSAATCSSLRSSPASQTDVSLTIFPSRTTSHMMFQVSKIFPVGGTPRYSP